MQHTHGIRHDNVMKSSPAVSSTTIVPVSIPVYGFVALVVSPSACVIWIHDGERHLTRTRSETGTCVDKETDELRRRSSYIDNRVARISCSSGVIDYS